MSDPDPTSPLFIANLEHTEHEMGMILIVKLRVECGIICKQEKVVISSHMTVKEFPRKNDIYNKEKGKA